MHQYDSICIISNRVKSIDPVSNFPSIQPRGRSCDPSLQPGCVRKSGHLDVECNLFQEIKIKHKKKQGNLHLCTSFLSLVATSTIAESTTVKWPMPELEACLQLDNLQAQAVYLHHSWKENVQIISCFVFFSTILNMFKSELPTWKHQILQCLRCNGCRAQHANLAGTMKM